MRKRTAGLSCERVEIGVFVPTDRLQDEISSPACGQRLGWRTEFERDLVATRQNCDLVVARFEKFGYVTVAGKAALHRRPMRRGRQFVIEELIGTIILAGPSH